MKKEMPTVSVIGAGLAGSEAAYQLAKRGFRVNLVEMRPNEQTPAHQTGLFAELVCSNSFRALSLENAVGVLKEEMRLLDSLIMKAATVTKVEAGGALALDRVEFSSWVTNYLKSHPNINVINREETAIPPGPAIIATGPLTSPTFSKTLASYFGEQHLYFYDAMAPIITADSVNFTKVFLQSRYDKGQAAYWNCPFNEEEFFKFYNYLIQAPSVEIKDFEKRMFEACLPIEEIARRGPETLLFGPMKPVGLTNPFTGKKPFAVVQLRPDNALGSLYNLVGFQTNLKFPAQRELLKHIPGLERADIVRYGVMHRNTYLHGPRLLWPGFQTKKDPLLFLAGQITGVEGYVESAASGLIAGINLARYLRSEAPMILDETTAIGALSLYVTNIAHQSFEPMNVNFGLFAPLKENVARRERKIRLGQRALENLKKNIADQAILD